MSVFFTSDLHIGHRFIAGARKQGSYKDVDRDTITDVDIAWHDDMLADGWDALVGRGDTVWVLGDISGGTKSGQEKALHWICARPGTKHLITGNHDGAHPMYRDSHKWQRVYLEVFDSVQMAARRRIPLEQNHANMLLSHLPWHDDHSPEPRFTEWRLRENNDYLLHGHTHSAEQFNGREIHVGVDAWSFRPVDLETIAAYVLEHQHAMTRPRHRREGCDNGAVDLRRW